MPKQIFQPTPEWLKANGFEHTPICVGNFSFWSRTDRIDIDLNTYKKRWRMGYKQIYPQSEEDVLTLIRLLTE